MRPRSRPLAAAAAARSRRDALEFLLSSLFLLLYSLLFWATGASRTLAAALPAYLPSPLPSVVFIAFFFLFYEILLFPLSALFARLDLPPADRPSFPFGAWFRHWLRHTLFLLLLVLAGAFLLFTLWRLLPDRWPLALAALWFPAVPILSGWGPSLLLPRFRPPRPHPDPALLDALRPIARRVGIRVRALALWPADDSVPPVAFVGFGRTRTAVLSPSFRAAASDRLILFAAARLLASHWFLSYLLLAAHLLLFTAVLFASNAILHAFAPDPYPPQYFPLWLSVFFALAGLAGLLHNFLRRHAAIWCDRFALARTGHDPALLRDALRLDFHRAPYPPSPPLWQRPFLHTPPPALRLRHARRFTLRHRP